MSRNAHVTLDWADGTYLFRLPIGGVEELEENTGYGLPVLVRRAINQEFKVREIRETIRIGLIGGGQTPIAALTLLRRYFDERPYAENVGTAIRILNAVYLGAPDGEKPGKRGAARAKNGRLNSQTDEPPLPPTTEPALS
jgi:hypothetical protein